MKTLNFSQKTNFLAGSPQFPGMEFYVQSASLPGLTFNLPETKSQGMLHYLPSDSYSHGDLSLTALIDEDFLLYNLFYNEMLKSKDLTNPSYAQRYFDLYIQIFNNKGNLLFTENFHNCLLESLGDVSLETTDNSVAQTIQIGIKFDWSDIQHEGITEEKRKEFNVYPPKKPEPCECGCEDCNCKDK